MKRKVLLSITGILLLFSASAWSFESDLYLDGNVTFHDFAVFANAFGTQSGEPNYNPQCDFITSPDQSINYADLDYFLQQWLHNGILLETFSNGWGYLVDRRSFLDEGEYKYQIMDPDPYGIKPGYFAYAYRKGFFTEMYNIFTLQRAGYFFLLSVNIDLDPVGVHTLAGTIWLTQTWFADRPLASSDINVYNYDFPDPCFYVTNFQTDPNGRFYTDLTPGDYYFDFQDEYGYSYFEAATVTGDYHDFFFPDAIQAKKPNIYLYPTETTTLDVWISFPHGGSIVESIPQYDNGWEVTVEPNGTIDNQYSYLFYESFQPDHCQYEAGWVIPRGELESFFASNMSQTGFNQQEIDDFLDHWLPLLTEYPYYAIYPQYNIELDDMIKLNFSAEPDNLIRLIYSIRGLNSTGPQLAEPEIPVFERTGFTVTEWGVILH